MTNGCQMNQYEESEDDEVIESDIDTDVTYETETEDEESDEDNNTEDWELSMNDGTGVCGLPVIEDSSRVVAHPTA